MSCSTDLPAKAFIGHALWLREHGSPFNWMDKAKLLDIFTFTYMYMKGLTIQE
jgi:hypothetical protein